MAVLVADTAVIDPRAELADGVDIGPYCIVGPDVVLGEGTRLIAHVCLLGVTRMGRHNIVHPFCTIGDEPQDLSYDGSPTAVEIGDHNVFREGVTVHRGTAKEKGLTKIGSHNYFMATSHVAHDCVLGDRITIANGSMLAGHVHVESHAGISGGVAVHHYATIGGYSFVGGQSRIFHDVPPYMLVDGNPSRIRCVNVVGLRRNGITEPGIQALHEAHRLLYRAKMTASQASEVLKAQNQVTPEVARLLSSLQDQAEGRNGRARERLRKS